MAETELTFRAAFRLMDAADRRFAWELNQSEVPRVGAETQDVFERLCALSALASLATLAGAPAGFLLAMTPDADYHSPNFRWFLARYDRFLYVDRIAVAATHRRRGVGSALTARPSAARASGCSRSSAARSTPAPPIPSRWRFTSSSASPKPASKRPMASGWRCS
jgi:ribosomal protein S18 acetylase RimI-like enzyme